MTELVCRAYLHALDATLEMTFHERNEQGAMLYNPIGMDDLEGTFEEIDLDIVDSDDEFEVLASPPPLIDCCCGSCLLRRCEKRAEQPVSKLPDDIGIALHKHLLSNGHHH